MSLRTACRLFAVAAVALSLVAADGRASITPEAQAIVERYVQVTGGAEALESEQALHVSGRLSAIELKGSFDTWSQRPDRMRMGISLGPVRQRLGFDGTNGWETDLNSKRVRKLEGRELEALRSDAYFENEMWARPGQGGGKVTHGSKAFRSGDEWQCLLVAPPVGPSRRLWFSGRTGLLMRVVTHFDQYDADYYLSGYKLVRGRKRPTVLSAADDQVMALVGEGEPDHYHVDSVRVNPKVDPALFAMPANQAGPVTWLRGHGAARVPFRYGGRHVWIKASINGAPPADFLLDTGASSTAIDRDYAHQIGLTQQGQFAVQGAGGTGEGSFARVGSIAVKGAGDGVSLKNFNVALIDLGEGSEVTMWRKMVGLIGYDFLSQFVVEIDYDRGVVTFHDPASYRHSGTGATLDMKLLSGIPVISMEIDGRCSGDFIVDVGNSFGLIVHGSLVRSCGFFRDGVRRKEAEIYGGGIGGGFVNWLCRLDSLELGPYEIREPIVGLTLGSQGLIGSKDLAGNIGNAVLERFRCTFDYAHGRLHLDPGKRFAARDHFSRTGVTLIRISKKVMAVHVLPGSAAAEAGFELNDEVAQIDGKPACEYTPEQIDRVLTRGDVGTVHTFVVVRDGKRKALSLTLQDVI
jgi:hypothetical protein